MSHTDSEAPTIPLTEAARRLGISRSNAYVLVRTGKFPIPFLRPSPKRMVVSVAALDAYLKSGTSTGDAA